MICQITEILNEKQSSIENVLIKLNVSFFLILFMLFKKKFSFIYYLWNLWSPTLNAYYIL